MHGRSDDDGGAPQAVYGACAQWLGGARSPLAWVALLLASTAVAQTAVNIVPPNLSGPVAGSLPDRIEVTPAGAAIFSVALPVPPGTAGLAPEVGLSYNSQAGDGVVARGWSIDGLSSITRCGKIIAIDGVRRAVKLTTEDEFCLDGQRLIRTSGTAHGTATYRLEIDPFANVQSFAGASLANGPDSWQVRTKEGAILRYGTTAESQVEAAGKTVVLNWALSRREDRSGNYIDYLYDENGATGEHAIRQIRYTGNVGAALLPYHALNFVYETRPDPWRGWVVGAPLQQNRRLTRIQAVINTDAAGNGGTVVRELRLGYGLGSPNGRSLVDSISDCGRDGTCLPATRLNWTSRDPSANTLRAAGSGNWGAGPVISFSSDTLNYGSKGQQLQSNVLVGDLNGDGRADLLYSAGTGTWQACLSQSSNRFACSNWAGPAVRSERVVNGDFDGDGLMDIAVPSPVGTGAEANLDVCLSTGSEFKCTVGRLRSYGQLPGRYIASDFDGDGRDDILVVNLDAAEQAWLCRSAQGLFYGCTAFDTGGAFILDAEVPPPPMSRVFRPLADFDGDGRADFLYYRTKDSITGTFSARLTTDTGFVLGSPATTSIAPYFGGVQGRNALVDSNSDPVNGYPDVHNGIDNPTGGSRSETCHYTGVGFACTVQNHADAIGTVYDAADYDGDGRPDSLNYSLNTVAQLKPDGTRGPATAWVQPLAGGGLRVAGDFNGDGLTDIAYYDEATQTWSVSLAGFGGYADLLARVTNGFGRVTEFQYKGLHDPGVYTRGAAVAYPSRNLVSGPPVVSRVRKDNGMGGWLDVSYRYAGARADSQGRGSLGFETVTVEDLTRRVTTVTTLSQSFPTIGMPLQVTARHADGAVLDSTRNTLAFFQTAAGSGTSFYPYIRQTVSTRRDLNGADFGTTTRRIGTTASGTDGIDAFGNVTSATETVASSADSFSTTTVNTYDNLTADWLIGLLRSSAVTKTATQSDPPPPATPVLALAGCTANTPTTAPTPATLTCTLGNSGAASATSVTYAGPANTSLSGPPSCAAGSSNCGTVTLITATTAGSYVGTLTATPIPAGTAASVAVNLTVGAASAPALTLAGCASTTPTIAPTRATMTCTLGNSGQAAATSVAYTSPASTTVSGPSTCAAGSTACGTVTVTTATTAGNYSGTLTATPTPAGSAAAAAVNLTVNPAPPGPALTLAGCTSITPTTAPTRATMSCTLGNSSVTAATSVAYSSPANTTVTGPSSCAGSSTNCGTVMLSTATLSGTYTGTLTATPTPSGSAASVAVNLTVNPPAAALTFGSCSMVSPTTSPTPATLSCTLANAGQGAASSVSYASAPGTTVTGPSSCAANTTNCGTVTVTTATAAGTYSGTLTATPSPAGTAASRSVSLVVSEPSGAALAVSPGSLSWGTVPKGVGNGAQSVTVSNTGGTATTLSWSLSYTSGSSTIGSFEVPAAGTTCASGGTLAPGGSCVLAVAYWSACVGGARNATLNVLGTGAAPAAVALSATTSSAGECP